MKYASVLLFTFLGLLTAVAALPLSNRVNARDGGASQALEERFVDENNPIFARYFGPASQLISERDYADDDVESRQYAEAAGYVAAGIVEIVEVIKGKIEQDKKVPLTFIFETFANTSELTISILIDAKSMDQRYDRSI